MAGTKLSGLMSGMDTDSIVQQLVEVRKSRVDTVKKKQLSLNYKQDAWKSLNTKLKNLQSKYVSNMRFSTSYAKKTTKVSNSAAVSVITGENAVNGVQSLEVKQLAKTGYLTGAQLGDGEQNYTALTKLEDLGVTFDGNGEGSFAVTAGKTTVDIKVTKDSTISDVLTKIKEAGLNASFDAKTQRFFISSKESGVSNDFSITATDANGANALSKMGLQVSLAQDKATKTQYEKLAAYLDGTSSDDDIMANMSTLITDEINNRVAAYQKKYTSLMDTKTEAEKKITEINEKYAESPLKSVDEYKTLVEEKEKAIADLEAEIKKDEYATPEDKKAAQESLKDLQKELETLKTEQTDANTLVSKQEAIEKAQADMDAFAGADQYVTIEASEVDGKTVYTATATQKLQDEVADTFVAKAKYAAAALADSSSETATGATKVSGQDAEIILNGASFKNNTNVFEINGLTFTALSETKEGETVTITTQDDTDGIYDMIKNFIKEYNSIINEMDKLYNTEDPKLDPLTSDEKDAMSDREVEEWETKLKDSALRKDSTINSISSTIREVMSSGIEVNGKTMYLNSFGIDYLSYFNAADNEKHAFHIDGDPDDGDTSGNADKLKSMISSDPSTVISFFTKLSQNLYDKMSSLSKSVDGYRSYGNFYDDKKMTSDYNDYNTKISEMEEKLNDYEDSWYSKFSKMETAMAKMQSNANAISGLLGG